MVLSNAQKVETSLSITPQSRVGALEVWMKVNEWNLKW